MVTEGCVIDGAVESSIISEGVTIEEGAVIYDSILMPGCHVKKGAQVQYAIVGEDSVIGENAVIGERPENIADDSKDTWGVAVVGHRINISDGSKVAPKAIIYEDM
jgi:glucose-1-phosphate adenylyltransferase